MSYAKGDFVDSAFPVREAPDRPEIKRLHVGYVERVAALSDGTRAAVVLYTTSVARPAGRPKRKGEVDIDERSSRAMGMQKAFTIDVFRVMIVPINEQWFPSFGQPGFGIRGKAPENLQRHIGQMFDRAIVDQEPLLHIYPRRPKRKS